MMNRDDGRIGSGKASMLQWWVNPSDCQWKVTTRTYLEKIPGGAVHHEWPQTGFLGGGTFKGSRFDQPMLSMTFQSGIINPGGYDDIFWGNATNTDAPPGLGNFYDFLSLLEAPDMLSSGKPNYIHLLYKSPVFSKHNIHLQGFFTEEGVSWTDSADNPNTITSWGATFVVFHCRPSLNNLRTCLAYQGWGTR